MGWRTKALAASAIAVGIAVEPEPAGACSCATATMQAELVEVRQLSGAPAAPPNWPDAIGVGDGYVYDPNGDAISIDFEVP
jgi:hypothetical protein